MQCTSTLHVLTILWFTCSFFFVFLIFYKQITKKLARHQKSVRAGTINMLFILLGLIRLTRCHMASEKFDAELLHNEFLSNLLCNWHELYYSPTFFLSPFINRSIKITRILTFLSEQRAPFSTMFASRAFHNVKWSQHSTGNVQVFQDFPQWRWTETYCSRRLLFPQKL